MLPPPLAAIAVLFLCCWLLVINLRLVWRLVTARTEVNIFNYSLALALTVTGQSNNGSGFRKSLSVHMNFAKGCNCFFNAFTTIHKKNVFLNSYTAWGC